MADFIKLLIPITIPLCLFQKIFKKHNKDFILIMGVKKMLKAAADNQPLAVNFSTDPVKFEPCFYNQDWYLKKNLPARRH